ncbi:sugar phosphate isomerase/epimerase [Rhodocytophaga aerolata]|uniref:Sugar phosphate isomerase/epimerase n=1 Tax=Rhodocytophaga aerolata TaxID=455078 RepID=A0ABT8QZI1_9BACT|nr:sugar phosphate isomerase/epimerase [Rhodocytophaga aerolata]MDO1445084.1 sugar phosphate isomerase/epimerase [Rhodocytophaga aerolata]
MANRRFFLKHTGALALGTLLFPACSSETKNETTQTADTTAAATSTTQTTSATGNLGPVGLQLYSVKDVIEGDLKGILQQLATIGYKEVESYPGQKGHYFGYTPEEFKTMLSDMGLTLVSSHFGSGSRDGKKVDTWQQATLLQNFEALVEQAAKTGQKYLTCSSISEGLHKTQDDLKRTAELFNKAGESCKKAGMQFAYHNHAFEFEKVGNAVKLDYLIENTDPENVKYELDLFWVVAGGQDPIAYLNRYPNRFPLGHVKDMDKADKTKNTEIGSGSINYQQILDVAKEKGMQHFFVEQESFTRPSMESMKMNYDYLSKLTV